MEHLHGGHLLALFGGLDAVGKTDHAGASQHGLEQHQAQPYPAGGESIQTAATRGITESAGCRYPLNGSFSFRRVDSAECLESLSIETQKVIPVCAPRTVPRS